MHIAVKFEEGEDWSEVSKRITTHGLFGVESVYCNVMADPSQSVLKEKLRARISSFPHEKWLILSGNTVAEKSEPPVRFRSL